MRKVTTLGLVALTIAVNMIPMTTEAASSNAYNQCSGGQKVITVNGNCNLEDLQSQLKNAGVNADYSNLADCLKQQQQNCQNANGGQASTNKSINDVLGAQVTNNNCPQPSNGNTNNQQIADAIKKATEAINKNCNNQAPVVTQPAENTETDTEETNVPEVTTPVDNDSQGSTTNTNNGNTDNTTPPKTEETTPTDTTNQSYAKQVVDLVNAERAKEGLSALKIDEKVTKAATVRAYEIQTKFDHIRPDGSGFVTALKEQGVTYRGAGENIAWGQRTPQEVVTAWMNSPGHRANIMNPNYVYIGVGNVQNSAGTQYWVQNFTY